MKKRRIIKRSIRFEGAVHRSNERESLRQSGKLDKSEFYSEVGKYFSTLSAASLLAAILLEDLFAFGCFGCFVFWTILSFLLFILASRESPKN